MARKSKPTTTAAGTLAGNGQSKLGVSNAPPLLGTAKAKTGKKDLQAKQVPKTPVKSGTGSTKTQAVGKTSKDLATPKIVKKADKIKENNPSQQPKPQPLKCSLPEREGSVAGKSEVKKESPSQSLSLAQLGASSSAVVERKNATSKPGS